MHPQQQLNGDHRFLIQCFFMRHFRQVCRRGTFLKLHIFVPFLMPLLQMLSMLPKKESRADHFAFHRFTGSSNTANNHSNGVLRHLLCRVVALCSVLMDAGVIFLTLITEHTFQSAHKRPLSISIEIHLLYFGIGG
jgi:hypothetical protein